MSCDLFFLLSFTTPRILQASFGRRQEPAISLTFAFHLKPIRSSPPYIRSTLFAQPQGAPPTKQRTSDPNLLGSQTRTTALERSFASSSHPIPRSAPSSPCDPPFNTLSQSPQQTTAKAVSFSIRTNGKRPTSVCPATSTQVKQPALPTTNQDFLIQALRQQASQATKHLARPPTRINPRVPVSSECCRPTTPRWTGRPRFHRPRLRILFSTTLFLLDPPTRMAPNFQRGPSPSTPSLVEIRRLVFRPYFEGKPLTHNDPRCSPQR